MSKETENVTTNLDASRVPPPLPCSQRYFAGWQNCEDTVSGGIGATIEDAVNDYLANHAYDEADWGGCDNGDLMTVSVYSTIDEDEAHRRGLDEEFDESWSFMLDRVVEERTYVIRRNGEDYSFEFANKLL